MLRPFRRHRKGCLHRDKGRDFTKCRCPIWCDGTLHGKRYRAHLDTWDWSEAMRKCLELQNPAMDSRPLCAHPGCTERVDSGRCERHQRTIAAAVEAFQNHVQGLESSTRRKYRNVLRQFAAFCARSGLENLTDVSVEDLDAYRASRELARTTAQKELETLRQFFAFCRDRNWTDDNPARRIRSAKGVKPAEVVPYTPEDLTCIIAACDGIGRTAYERLRARAMILLLNNTALRVSDVATLARDRVRDGRILIRTLKTGEAVELPLRAETLAALAALPAPRGASGHSRYYFWNGATSRRAVVGIAERTLATVFSASGVAGAHAHRFRHTVATRLLGMGASLEDVADILGNSPGIVRKHYAKWSRARQARIDQLMMGMAEESVTPAALGNSQAVN